MFHDSHHGRHRGRHHDHGGPRHGGYLREKMAWMMGLGRGGPDDDTGFRFGGFGHHSGRGRGPFGGGPFGGGPGGDGPFGGRPFGGRGGGRARVFGGGELRLLLLSLVAEQDRHGYELIKAIEDLAGGAYAPSPGVVYPTLALLGDEGLIANATPGGDSAGSRRAFTATEAGRAELAGRSDELARIVARLGSLAQAGERAASPPVARAVANLMTALRSRATAGDFDNAKALEVAALLDEVTQRIERL